MAKKKTATARKPAARRLGSMVAIRLLEADAKRLDALAVRLPFISRHALARAALKIGMDVISEDPTRLVATAVQPSHQRRRRS